MIVIVKSHTHSQYSITLSIFVGFLSKKKLVGGGVCVCVCSGEMAGFLKKVLALSSVEDTPPTETVKVSFSAHEVPSDQTTKLDQQTGVPVISPLDTLEEVS